MLTEFRTPRIIKETSSGLFCCDIRDEMLQNREIECVGQINAESVYSLCLQLRYLQKQDPNKEILMYINSPGGEVSSGLALYDVMKAIKCPIRTICTGIAASMGAVLFVSGDTRQMLQHARVMIHDPLIAGGVGGSALQLQELSKDLMKTRETVAKIIAEHTGKSLKEVYKKTATDSYFDAEEAIKFGLADCIIDSL